MKRIGSMVALVVALGLSGCSGMSPGGFFTSEDFDATLSASGYKNIATVSIGTISVSPAGTTLLSILVDEAGKYLADQFDLKGCVFSIETRDKPRPRIANKIIIEGTAECMAKDQLVTEIVTLTLTPVVDAAA